MVAGVIALIAVVALAVILELASAGTVLGPAAVLTFIAALGAVLFLPRRMVRGEVSGVFLLTPSSESVPAEICQQLAQVGATGDLTRRFLSALPSLTVQHWKLVQSRSENARESLFTAERRSRRRLAAWVEIERLADDSMKNEALARVLGLLKGWMKIGTITATDADAALVAQICCMLLYSESISADAIATIYAPFEGVIPMNSWSSPDLVGK